MKFCFSCGNKITEGTQFCPECGTSLVQDERSEETTKSNTQSTTATFPQHSAPYLKNKKLLFGVLAAILILYFATGGAVKASPVSVAEEFIEHGINSDWKSAERLWAQSGIENRMAELNDSDRERSVFTALRNLTQRYYTDLSQSILTEYTVVNEEINGSEAYIYFEFVFSDGKQEKVVFRMVEEEGEWKVFAFKSGQ